MFGSAVLASALPQSRPAGEQLSAEAAWDSGAGSGPSPRAVGVCWVFSGSGPLKPLAAGTLPVFQVRS